MGQRIGNVGVLNLLNATEESVREYERIDNVGAVLYRAGNSHLLSLLNIGNVGAAIELPKGFVYYNGTLEMDAAYFDSLEGEIRQLINGSVIIGKDVQPEQLEGKQLDFIVNGEIYAPSRLLGVVNRIFAKGSRKIKGYTGAPPQFLEGSVVLSNAFLQAAEEPMYLVMNGVFNIPREVDMELFDESIHNLDVNGVLTIHEEHEAFVYKKMTALPNGVMVVIPNGYDVLKKKVKFNSRSIRSFQEKKLWTKKPVIFEKDISREMFEKAIGKIDSKSYIVCSEELEDLLYERLDRLETEVLSYEHHYVLIEGDQEWSNDQFLAMNHPVNLIVEGILVLKDDVAEEVLRTKVAAIDLLGEIQVADKKVKGALQSKLRVNEGRIIEQGQAEEKARTGLQNIGELAL